MEDHIYKYDGKDILVTFSKIRCSHVGKCIHGLPKVFMEIRRPWIMPDLASADKVADIVLKCPTGALHYDRKDGGPQEEIPTENRIILDRNGPLYLHGNLEIINREQSFFLKDTRVALCRCGHTRSLPYCDGRHYDAGFHEPGWLGTPPNELTDAVKPEKLVVTFQPKGPYLVKGPFILQDARCEQEYRNDKAALCSCGLTQNPPFCDGNHTKKRGLSRLLWKR